MKKPTHRIATMLLAATIILCSVCVSPIGKIVAGAEETAQTICFGSYPQSRISDEAIVSDLNSVLSASDWKSFGYYSGNDSNGSMSSSDYMKYADVELNGEKFRAITFSAYRPVKTFYDGSVANSSQDDNGYSINTVYWFKYEPLKWTLLDKEAGLLLCESIVDAQSFNNSVYKIGVDTDGDLSSDEYISYNDSSSTVYANNYAESSIRKWLNEDFINTAFSQEQQGLIIETTIDNTARSSEYSCENTTDAVFLPSYEDVLNPAYGFSSSDRISDVQRVASGSDYAKCQGLKVNASASDWRLRSAGSGSSFDCRVYDTGEVANNFDDIDYTNVGIRPALCIESKTVSFDSKGGNEIESQTIWGDELVLKPDDPIKEGYTFGDWYDNSTSWTKFDFEKPICEDKALAAKWSINQYSIEFNTDGGSEVDNITQDYNSAVTAPEDPTKDGFVFAGWDSQIPSVMPAENLTITAIWTVEDTYYNVVGINDDGSFEYGQINVFTAGNVADTYTVPNDPTFEGYTFSGWATSENSQASDCAPDGTYGDINRSFYPVYEINKFAVVYYNDDGTVFKTFENIEFSSEVPIPEEDPTKEYHTFIGWAEDIPETMPNKPLSFTASYKKDPTVTYYNRGAVYASYIIKEGQPIKVPSSPERFGFTFVGWEPEIPDNMPGEDINFTAKWKFGFDFSLILSKIVMLIMSFIDIAC